MANFSKLKQIKDLREQAKTVQNQLDTVTATGKAEGGKISMTINGNQKITDITIDESLVHNGDNGKIEEGIQKAHEKATKDLQKQMAKMMRSGGLDMPDMGSLMG